MPDGDLIVNCLSAEVHVVRVERIIILFVVRRAGAGECAKNLRSRLSCGKLGASKQRCVEM